MGVSTEIHQAKGRNPDSALKRVHPVQRSDEIPPKSPAQKLSLHACPGVPKSTGEGHSGWSPPNSNRRTGRFLRVVQKITLFMFICLLLQKGYLELDGFGCVCKKEESNSGKEFFFIIQN